MKIFAVFRRKLTMCLKVRELLKLTIKDPRSETSWQDDEQSKKWVENVRKDPGLSETCVSLNQYTLNNFLIFVGKRKPVFYSPSIYHFLILIMTGLLYTLNTM